MKKRKVYLVGAGPGRADLITARGLNLLREADIVIYDYLIDRSLLDSAKETAELICCDSLGKRRYSDGFLDSQSRINALLVKKAKEGRRVVRLKNGDPAVFSRASQELEALAKEGIEFEIVPGVTAASAVSAFSGIPLTDRRFASSCIFVTGHEDPGKKASLIDWQAISTSGTIVLYMAVDNMDVIVARLLKAGRDKSTKIAIVENASLPAQRVISGTLGGIIKKARESAIRPPAIIIIGEVAGMEESFNWFKKSKKVLFTGLSRERFFSAGSYFHIPLVRIEPMPDYEEFDSYLKDIKDFNWVVFASRYGVEYFFKRLRIIGRDSRALEGVKMAAVGNSTGKRLLDFGIIADMVPEDESSRGLLDRFRDIGVKGERIFLPRSDISDKGLSGALEKLGADVTTSYAYRNVMPKGLPELDLDFFDEIIFTSPSTVRNFKARYRRPPEKVKINCIGDVTRREAKICGLLS